MKEFFTWQKLAVIGATIVLSIFFSGITSCQKEAQKYNADNTAAHAEYQQIIKEAEAKRYEITRKADAYYEEVTEQADNMDLIIIERLVQEYGINPVAARCGIDGWRDSSVDKNMCLSAVQIDINAKSQRLTIETLTARAGEILRDLSEEANQ